MSDLELSEKVVADILTKLLPRGLNPLHIETIADVTEADIGETFLRSILFWLQREDIVAFEYIDRREQGLATGYYMYTVLTSKGFDLLGHQFDPAEGLSIGEAAKKVSAGEASYAKAGSFFGGLLGGFTKSIG